MTASVDLKADMQADKKAGLSVRVRQSAPIALDVTLDCAAGEVLALVGPSGSGKSTILRCIAGLHAAEEGGITCNGETWFNTSSGVNRIPQDRRVGFVFQNYALFPHLTALENVAEALLHLPSAQRVIRAHDLLDRVHLDGLEDRKPAALSGGQQQRVAVARALAREPRALLLDEPFSAVDRATRQKLYRELAELKRDLSMPVILVTHNLVEATMLADRMIILHHGETLQAGAPLDVMARPESAEVARLVDLRNIFEARVVEQRREEGVTVLDWAGRTIFVARQDRFAVGETVDWVIPAASALLLNPKKQRDGTEKNLVTGRIGELVPLGESVSLTVVVDDANDLPLNLSLPAHFIRRTELGLGDAVTVSLLADAIHLMARRK